MTAINSYTNNFRFSLINYNVSPWHSYEWQNWQSLDAVLGTYFPALDLQGVWKNSTVVTAGQSWVDSAAGQVFVCAVNHTTAATGTFLDERTANPTYWSGKSIPANSRGNWATATLCNVGDFVVHEYQYAICLITHTSNTWAGDAANWSILIDGTNTLNDATTAANNAYTHMIEAQTAAATFTWNNLPGKPTFAAVATSGTYTDLTGKPTLATVATSGAHLS